MRKNLLVIFLFTFAAWKENYAQTIKPLQYSIIIERTIERSPNKTYRYIEKTNSSNWDIIHCYNNSTNVCPDCQPNTQYGYLCAVLDTGRWTCAIDYHSLKIYYNGTPQTVGNDVILSSFALGESRKYYDTVHIYQAQFNVTQVQTTFTQGDRELYQGYYSQPGFSPNTCPVRTFTESIYPQGEFYDQTFMNGSDSRYSVNTRVQIVPNLDPTYTLPSHDRVLISASVLPSFGTPVWQYQDSISALTNTWHDISGSLTKNSGTILEVSGIDILGANYSNLLHSTIKFRIRNSSSSTFSNIVPFTLRLSSPHIASVTPTNLDCYERHEGAMKITFDRALITGERLNILAYDTVNQVSYSALNLSELAADNSYTWTPELRAGTYYVTLLGKYAKGIEYDSYINTRVDTVSIYTALNSVNFDDGFDTPGEDNFDAYTDFTGYAQATYTGSLTHIAFKQLTQPARIRFVARVDSNVLCKGVAAGVITLAADGGKFNYKYSLKHENSASWTAWTDFDNNNVGPFYISDPNFWGPEGVVTKVRNLSAGKYQIRVRDMVDCFAKDSIGEEIAYSFTITEPEKGLTIDLLEISPITSVDSANGLIKVHISGGTPFINGETFHWPYDITWTDSTNQAIEHTETILEANKRMETKTAKLPVGTYTLRVYDAWHSAAGANNAGCFLELNVPIRKPAPLIVNVEQRKQINCFDSANAELMAMPTGGIPIDSLRYTFKWYRITGENNILLPVTDSLITDLGPGNYRVEITDKYDNTALSPVFTVTEPLPLQLQMSSTQSSCYTTGDGTLGVLVTGGTPFANGYKYEWSTGDRTPTVNNVAGGNYLVIITDSMFCMAMDTISVTSPARLIPEVVVQQVSCRGGCDGQIAVTTTGGLGVYTYEWSNGATTSTLSDLCPGLYWFRVTDANGCSDSIAIELDNPDTLAVNLGPDRKICIGQTIRLDATASDTAALTYNWTATNGFTASTAKVAITQAGTYFVSVSNQRGCIVRDTIVTTAENSTINTDFVVSTQAFVNQAVSLINISQPRTDSVKWIVAAPGNVIQVVQQNNDRCELKFSDTGLYSITMRAYYPSGCIEDSTKVINVIAPTGPITGGNQGNAFLKAYAVIYPNPNTGTFKVDLEFSEVTRARLRLINTLTNIIVDDRMIQGSDEYLLDYNMSPLANGVYILVIDAAKGSFVYKVIIAH